MSLTGVRAPVLGAGGAARAVGRRACARPVRASPLRARRAEAAGAIAESVGYQFGEMPPPRGSWDLLVNATPVGMHPDVDETPVAATARLDGGLVYDLVYNPAETRLLREAARRDARRIGGLDMLVAQAAASSSTGGPGQRRPTGVMRAGRVNAAAFAAGVLAHAYET